MPGPMQQRGSKTSDKLKSNFMETILLKWNCIDDQRREILIESCIVFIKGWGGGLGSESIISC